MSISLLFSLHLNILSVILLRYLHDTYYAKMAAV